MAWPLGLALEFAPFKGLSPEAREKERDGFIG